MFKNYLPEECNYVRNSFAFSEMHTEVFKGKMHNVCYILDYILAKKIIVLLKDKKIMCYWRN